jgi:hypothetical protein
MKKTRAGGPFARAHSAGGRICADATVESHTGRDADAAIESQANLSRPASEAAPAAASAVCVSARPTSSRHAWRGEDTSGRRRLRRGGHGRPGAGKLGA